MFDLNGRTLMPGFYDSHSHFSLSAIEMSQGFDLRSPPMGQVRTIANIISNVRHYIEKNKIAFGQKIFGFGYNDEQLQDKRLLTKVDLDLISKNHFIIIMHVSGHVGSVNSLILEKMKIGADTKCTGGEIGLGLDGQPNGVFKEQALYKFGLPFYKKLNKNSIIIGEKAYFSAGYTTAHDMVMDGSQIKAYLDAKGSMKIDINAYQLLNDLSTKLYNQNKYIKTSNFHVKGVKAFLDGSIQTFTAALSHPYLINSPFSKKH